MSLPTPSPDPTQPERLPTEKPEQLPTEKPESIPTEQPERIPTEEPANLPEETPDPNLAPDPVDNSQPILE